MRYKKSIYNLPVNPPKGLKKWMLDQELLDAGVIVYKMEYHQDEHGRNTRDVRCTCSSCGTGFYSEYQPLYNTYTRAYGWYCKADGCAVYDGEHCTCPICGAAVKTQYIGKYRGDVLYLQETGAITVEKVNNRIAVIWWRAEQILRNGCISYNIYPWEAYVFDGKRCVKNVAYITYGYFNTQCYTGEWLERSKCNDTIGGIAKEYIYPFSPEIFDGTDLENAKFDIYYNKNEEFLYPVSYLRLYQRHNTVENLVMSGCINIIDDILNGGYGLVASLRKSDKLINWKARKPAAMLGLTKPEFKKFKTRNLREISFYLKFKDYGVTFDNMDKLTGRYYSGHLENIADEFKENIPRACRYIEKQRKKYGDIVSLSDLIDYWRMVEPADRLGDMNVRYPQNLEHAHNELIRLKKWKEDSELIEKFAKRYKELSVYSYSNDKLMIRPCHDESELIAEGKILEHCVASYAKKHASGKTSIFFVRHTDAPDEPFYTLEWRNNKIIQDHGYKNRLQTDEIKRFEKEWLEYVEGVMENGKRYSKAS